MQESLNAEAVKNSSSSQRVGRCHERRTSVGGYIISFIHFLYRKMASGFRSTSVDLDSVVEESAELY